MKEKIVNTKDFLQEIENRKDQRLISIAVIQENSSFNILYFFDNKDVEIVKIKLPMKKPILPTITKIFPSAEIYERENHDFFGIEFEGNNSLHEKLFLPDNWKGKPPLIKED